MIRKYDLFLWLFRSSSFGDDLFQVQKFDVSMNCIFNTIRFYKKHYCIKQVTIKERL